MSMDLSEFFQMFFEESLELLNEVETTLLNIDLSNCSDDEINLIFRGMHSIKGGSATFGFSDISEFTHTLETYLDNVRNKTQSLTTETVDLLLKSVDCIRGLIAKHQGNEHQDLSIITTIHHQFEELNQQQTASVKTDEKPSTIETPAPTTAIIADQSEPSSQDSSMESPDNTPKGWYIYFKPHNTMISQGNDPLRILAELKKIGSCFVAVNKSQLPFWDQMNFEQCYIGWDILIETDKTEEEIKSEIFDWVIGNCDLYFKQSFTSIFTKEELAHYSTEVNAQTIQAEDATNYSDPEPVKEQVIATKTTETPEHQPSEEQSPIPSVKKNHPVPAKESPSIRVSTEKVDEIINIVGELVITQAIFRQVIKNNEELLDNMKLKECLSQFSQNIRELQERAMVMRMLPISNVFNRFPRMVRDIAQTLGKKIELQITGENTEVDKTVMEKIGDPLVHLIRNSIDHGIEEPALRKKRNKPETGVLKLQAYHLGGAIIIDIIDDGNGLNTEKIRQKALEKGLITIDQTLTDDEIHALIFLPGFSTADAVTDLSGRGVGMDVVKKNIQAVGGTIAVYSTPGAGSRFSIKLPLTLSIIDGQILIVSGQTFIFPISSIVEIIQIKPQQVSKVAENNEVYYLRNKYISIIYLTQVFELAESNQPLSDQFLIVVEVNQIYFGIVIDELLGQQQIVIKSIEQNFKHVEGIAGATVLGDGTVALIIDVTGLVQLSAKTNQVNQREYLDHKI